MISKSELIRKLDNCPFCGENNDSLKIDSYFDKMSNKYYFIKCKCGATSKEIMMRPDICVYEELLNFWNTRCKNGDLAIDGRNKNFSSFSHVDANYSVND